jgi:hypothetical protein
MQTKKTIGIGNEDTITLPEGVSWEEVIKILKEDENQEFLRKIDTETFKYLLDEGNQSKVIQTLLNVLRKTDPQNADRKYAESLIETMKIVSRSKLNQPNSDIPLKV